MGKRILGLDIQNNALAAVVVDSGFKGSRLEAEAYVPLPQKAEDNDVPLVAALDQLTRQIDITGCACVASLPADHVFFRNLQVPFKQAGKIRQMLPFELEPSLPLPVEKLVVDFHVIRSDGHSGQTDLIAAAIEADRLQGYLDLLARHRIQPEMVTVGGYPAALCLSRLGEIPQNVMMVDVRSASSTVFMISGGQLNLVRSIPADRAYESRPEMICQNIQRTLFALEEFAEQPFRPEQIFITGSAVPENGFVSELARSLEIPAVGADWVKETAARISGLPEKGWDSSRMDNALALALMEVIGIKGINFRRGPFAVRKRWVEYKKQLVTSAVLAAVLLAAALTNVFLDFRIKKQRLNDLNAQLRSIFTTTFPEVSNIVDPVQQMRVGIDEMRKKALLPAAGGKDVHMVDILNEISSRIAASIDVKFSRMVVSEDGIVINGDTDTFNSVDAVKGQLEASEMFEEVTIVSTNKDDTGNRIRFRLKMRV
jgi:type II secretion system protein L